MCLLVSFLLFVWFDALRACLLFHERNDPRGVLFALRGFIELVPVINGRFLPISVLCDYVFVFISSNRVYFCFIVLCFALLCSVVLYLLAVCRSKFYSFDACCSRKLI